MPVQSVCHVSVLLSYYIRLHACILFRLINRRKKTLMNTETSYHLQFLMSDIKTARPRIPSPLTGAIFTFFC